MTISVCHNRVSFSVFIIACPTVNWYNIRENFYKINVLIVTQSECQFVKLLEVGMDINNKCLDEKALSSYLDERLSGSERERIEGHIADCNTCLDMLLVAYEARRKKFSTRPPRGLARTILAATIFFERKNKASYAGLVEKKKQ